MELRINMKEFTACLCVPACIDLCAAARQTCPSKPTRRQRNETLYRLATGYISRLRRRGNPASAEPGG